MKNSVSLSFVHSDPENRFRVQFHLSQLTYNMDLTFLLFVAGFSVVAATEHAELTTLKMNTSLPEVVSNNVSARESRGILPRLPLIQAFREATLPFVVRKLGLIECAGIDHATGGRFFETIMGPGADFGGNYLCKPTCDGECVPTQGLGEGPRSIYYPFGCRCAPNRCNADGPIVTELIRTLFKIICKPDPRCTCASMGPQGAFNGYLCNWINFNTSYPVSFADREIFPGNDPTYSPIRWCSCCPRAISTPLPVPHNAY